MSHTKFWNILVDLSMEIQFFKILIFWQAPIVSVALLNGLYSHFCWIGSISISLHFTLFILIGMQTAAI